MTIQLPADVEALIRQKVASGRYPSAEEALSAAVRLLDVYDRRLLQLQAKIRIGLDELDRGEGRELTPELWDEIDREADEALRRGEPPDPDVCP
jgi:putative addiction module CopG family antidote